jgi:hypothetical protein
MLSVISQMLRSERAKKIKDGLSPEFVKSSCEWNLETYEVLVVVAGLNFSEGRQQSVAAEGFMTCTHSGSRFTVNASSSKRSRSKI